MAYRLNNSEYNRHFLQKTVETRETLAGVFCTDTIILTIDISITAPLNATTAIPQQRNQHEHNQTCCVTFFFFEILGFSEGIIRA